MERPFIMKLPASNVAAWHVARASLTQLAWSFPSGEDIKIFFNHCYRSWDIRLARYNHEIVEPRFRIKGRCSFGCHKL